MADELSKRRVPLDAEAEKSVIGAVIVDPNRFSDVAELLSPDDFYFELNRDIFGAMQSLFLQGRSLDVVTVIDRLVAGGAPREETIAYLKNAADTVPTASNLVDYARIVRDKSLLRRLLEMCEDVATKAVEESEEAARLLDYAYSRVEEIARGAAGGSLKAISDVVLRTQEELSKGETAGLPTGFGDLDAVITGMGPGDLVIVGGRPGMGKTGFAMNVATSVARRSGRAVAIFSMEMTDVQLCKRMISGEAAVDSATLRRGDLSVDDWSKVVAAEAELAKLPVYIDDGGEATVSSMKAKLHKIENLGLVVIDYLQLMLPDKEASRRSDTKATQVGEITRSLKLMAKDLAVPVIVCSQLNRGPDREKEKRPSLIELRDSGSIEQDADMVLLLYREEYYHPTPENHNLAEVIVAKNRHGDTKTVQMTFLGKFTKFASLAREEFS